MADYSYQDLMKMQNDAIRRAEDMQKRARLSAGLEKEKQEGQHTANTKKEEPRRVPMPDDYLENLKQYGSNSSRVGTDQNVKANNKAKPPNEAQGLLSDLNIDSDKALLLSLILLLSEEKADEVLIMALIYMLT